MSWPLSTAMNIRVCVSFQIRALNFFVEICPEVGLLNHKVALLLVV